MYPTELYTNTFSVRMKQNSLNIEFFKSKEFLQHWSFYLFQSSCNIEFSTNWRVYRTQNSSNIAFCTFCTMFVCLEPVNIKICLFLSLANKSAEYLLNTKNYFRAVWTCDKACHEIFIISLQKQLDFSTRNFL